MKSYNRNILLTAMILLASPTYQYKETLEDNLVPLEPLNIQKREAKKTNDAFDDFVEEKLIQHTQALEQLLRMVQSHSDVVKQLVENMGKHIDKPRLPEHMEVQRPKPYISKDSNDSTITKLGRKIPMYGNLMTNLAKNQFSSNSQPNVVVEQSYRPAPQPNVPVAPSVNNKQ